ncbi:MAG: hypothetical protein ACKVUS_06815 [Saprospiraceae bacterium]
MKIVGYIEHPSLKITVFRTGSRTSVKFETSLYEQIFKLGDDERFATLEGVQKLVDSRMIDGVLGGFQQMHRLSLETVARAFPTSANEVFEQII